MSNLQLNLNSVSDHLVRDNLTKIQDFLNNLQNSAKSFQLLTISATANVTAAKLAHNLGVIPNDAILTRLIAPSAAKLTLKFASFSKEEIVYDLTGMADGDSLTANYLLGSATDIVTVLEKALSATTGSLA